MSAARDSGWREVEHTADREIEVWGRDFGSLLEAAAKGMYAVMEVETGRGEGRRRVLEVEGVDREDLLVAFLDELLYVQDRDRIACAGVRGFETGDGARVEIDIVPVVGVAKEIKAVTYHRLAVVDDEEGLRARVVFDV